MRGRNLLIALGILVVLVLAAVILMREPPPEKLSASFPTIKKDEVTKVWIRKPAKDDTGTADKDKKDAVGKVEFEEVVLEKEGAGDKPTWMLTSPVRYEAYSSYIDTMLSRMEELKIDAIAAESKSSWKELEIDANHRVEVRVFKGSTQLVDFFIGGYRGGATMVKFPDDEKIYRVKGSIRYLFAKPSRDWREKRILNIENEKVVRLEFTNTSGSFAFSKVEGKWADESVPAVPDYDEKKISGFVSTVAHLRATDFEDALKPDAVGLGPQSPRVAIAYTEGEAKPEGKDAAPDAASADAGEEGAEASADVHRDTILVGNKKDESSTYVMMEGGSQVFLISKYTAERLIPAADKFATPPKKEEAKPAADASTAPDAPAEATSIPPDIMKKIQAEINKQKLLKQLSSQQHQ
jgi:hypothetical protein